MKEVVIEWDTKIWGFLMNSDVNMNTHTCEKHSKINTHIYE